MRILSSFLKVLAASLVMAVVVYLTAYEMAFNLFLVILIGIVSYILLVFLFDIRLAKDVLKGLARLKKVP